MELFSPISQRIVADIKKELRLQGHYDTGALERSFQEYEELKKDTRTLYATALGYLQDLELGVEASEINPAKININKLAAWVQRKGVGGGGSASEAKGIAKSIIGKWLKEGKPLNGSYAFSRTGAIILAVEHCFQVNKAYTEQIDEIVYDSFDNEFFKTKSGTI